MNPDEEDNAEVSGDVVSEESSILGRDPSKVVLDEASALEPGRVIIDGDVAAAELFDEKEVLISFWKNRAMVHAQRCKKLREEMEERIKAAVKEVIEGRLKKPNGKVN